MVVCSELEIVVLADFIVICSIAMLDKVYVWPSLPERALFFGRSPARMIIA